MQIVQLELFQVAPHLDIVKMPSESNFPLTNLIWSMRKILLEREERDRYNLKRDRIEHVRNMTWQWKLANVTTASSTAPCNDTEAT